MKNLRSVEFADRVGDDGMVRFSRTLPPEMGMKSGARLTVRIVAGAPSPHLEQRGVTEEEIERICLTQFDERLNVIRFLEAEGSLALDSKFLLRGMEIMR